MIERELLGVHREYLVIEYAKGDRLYVPSDQVDLVSKYIGGEAPRISRLGSSEWSKAKARVRRRVRKIGQDLVKLYSDGCAPRGTRSRRTRRGSGSSKRASRMRRRPISCVPSTK